MKSFNESKGRQTRVSFDAESKSFTSAVVQHTFLQTLTSTAVVAPLETPATEQPIVQLKIAA